jgi:hypothetical protein
MSRAFTAALALVGLAVVAAGCGSAGVAGGSGGAVYGARPTVACLRTKGFNHPTTAKSQIGVIAAFATHGGLRAAAPSGNVVTIAFTEGPDGVAATERAYRRFAQGVYKHHIRDVMRAQGNAVLVWTKTPGDGELNDALGCLRSS